MIPFKTKLFIIIFVFSFSFTGAFIFYAIMLIPKMIKDAPNIYDNICNTDL